MPLVRRWRRMEYQEAYDALMAAGERRVIEAEEANRDGDLAGALRLYREASGDFHTASMWAFAEARQAIY
jgi:hypothetical protein